MIELLDLSNAKDLIENGFFDTPNQES